MQKDSIFLSVLWNSMPEIIETYANYKCHFEISFDVEELLNLEAKEVEKIGLIFKERGIRIISHAPYMGLSFGSVSYADLSHSRIVLSKLIETGNLLGSEKFVFHMLLPGSKNDKQKWLDEALESIKMISDSVPDDVQICFENVFEQNREVFDSFYLEFAKVSNKVYRCFDIAHAFIMLGHDGIIDWFRNIDLKEITHLHLHDNHGRIDEHLPLGMGLVDFPALFTIFEKHQLNPTVTLENFDKESLDISLNYIRTYL